VTSVSIPVPDRVGRVDVGLVQRADSGVAVDVSGSVDPRAYVANPGYLTPIQSVAYYVIPRGDFRWDPIYSTDLAVTWGKRIPQLRRAELFFRGVASNVFNRAGGPQATSASTRASTIPRIRCSTRSRRRRSEA